MRPILQKIAGATKGRRSYKLLSLSSLMFPVRTKCGYYTIYFYNEQILSTIAIAADVLASNYIVPITFRVPYLSPFTSHLSPPSHLSL